MTDQDWLDTLPEMSDEELAETVMDVVEWVDPYYKALGQKILEEAKRRLTECKNAST